MSKIKKIAKASAWWEHKDLISDFTKVQNPLGINVSDGEYMIRGDQKDHKKYYYVWKGVWYLSDDVKKDNGHNFVLQATVYHSYPRFTRKEWELIDKLSKKHLNQQLLNHLYMWKYVQELRNIRRESLKFRLQLLKDE